MNAASRFLVIYVILLILFSTDQAQAFHSSGRIDEYFSYREMSFYPPTMSRNHCYIEGQIINNSPHKFNNTSVTIYGFDFFDHQLWQETIYIRNGFEPFCSSNKGYFFSRMLPICTNPSKLKFEVSATKLGDKRNEEYITGGVKKKEDINKVDLIKLYTGNEKNRSFSFSIGYINKMTDEIIHWDGWPVSCSCNLYENSGTLLEPSKGNIITSFQKELFKSSQTVYVDIPLTPNSLSGILECVVNLGHQRIRAENTLLFTQFHDQKESLLTNAPKHFKNDQSKNSFSSNSSSLNVSSSSFQKCMNDKGEAIFTDKGCPKGYKTVKQYGEEITNEPKLNTSSQAQTPENKVAENANQVLLKCKLSVSEWKQITIDNANFKSKDGNHFVAFLIFVENENEKVTIHGGGSDHHNAFILKTSDGITTNALNISSDVWRKNIQVYTGKDLYPKENNKGWIVFEISKSSIPKRLYFIVSKVNSPHNLTNIGQIYVDL
jgi:hypothetical protein